MNAAELRARQASAARATTVHPNHAIRWEVARQIQGRGVEFGPGCHPLPLGRFVESVRYCDSLDRDEFEQLFPEAGPDVCAFPEITWKLDVDADDVVGPIGAGSQDFVVANHLLEHLVNPLRFLEQAHQILRDEGILWVAVPDKRYMFDQDRRRTTLDDLVARYEAGVREASAERVTEYYNRVHAEGVRLDPGQHDYAETVEQQRRRSIHMNVWLIDDVIAMFQFAARHLGSPYELIDGVVNEIEILLLFRKAASAEATDDYAVTLSRLLMESHQRFLEKHYLPRLETLEENTLRLHHQLLVMDERLREAQNFTRRIKQVLRSVPGAKYLISRLRGSGKLNGDA